MNRFFRPVTGLALVQLSLAVGCGFETQPGAAEAVGTTHGAVRVERSEQASLGQNGATVARAEAVAGFVHVPALVDPRTVIEGAGLGTPLPDTGMCDALGSTDLHGPLNEASRVEFLDAGGVSLTVDRQSVSLAPYNFPTVTDSISGLLYSTRDRAAEPLPAGVPYSLGAEGLELRTETHAPAALSAVTLGGLPLAEVTAIPRGAPLDITWNVGAPGDRILAELIGSDGAVGARCAFADEVGAGTITAVDLPARSEVVLALHRIRTHHFESPQIDDGELVFDFEITRRVAVE